MTTENNNKGVRNRRVHMANERTFLAWIRTSIAIMAFGFVVEKFALFTQQLSLYLEHTVTARPLQAMPVGRPSILGALLVALGAVMGVFSFVRYKKVERQIDEDTYQPSMLLDMLLTAALVAIGMFLLLYLVRSIW